MSISCRPKSPPSPACGLSAATAIRRRGAPSALERLVCESDDPAEPFRSHAPGHVLERGVRGHVTDPHGAVRKQHHAVAGAGEIRQKFSVPAIVVSGEIERLLADRAGADRIDRARKREPHRGRDRVIGDAAALGGRLARRNKLARLIDIDEADRRQITPQPGGRDGGGGIFERKLLERGLMRGAGADEKKGQFAIGDTGTQRDACARHDLRADSSRISRGHRDPWTGHLPISSPHLWRTLAHNFEHEKL